MAYIVIIPMIGRERIDVLSKSKEIQQSVF